MLVFHFHFSFLLFLLTRVYAVYRNAGVSISQDRQTTSIPFTLGHWTPQNHFLDLEAFVSQCPAVSSLVAKFKLGHMGA